MLVTGEGLVVYPVVVVEVEGIMCRALLDTGAGSSYASATLIERQPDHKENKKIEMMMTSTSQRIEMYNVRISNIKGGFSLPAILSKVAKGVLRADSSQPTIYRSSLAAQTSQGCNYG